MKPQPGSLIYRELNSITQKRMIGSQFASASAIGPQIRELLKLDKLPTLRYLVICRRILFNTFQPLLIKPKGKRKAVMLFSNHELLKEVNLNSTLFQGLKITPKNEDDFYELINSINRMSLLFIYDELILKNKKKLFLQEMKKLGEGLEFVFGGDSERKVFSEIERFVDYAELAMTDEQVDTTIESNTLFDRETEPTEPLANKAVQELEKKDEDEYLDRKQMIALLKISYPTLHAHVKKGIIPKPIYVGSLPRWRRSEIMDHLRAKEEKQ